MNRPSYDFDGNLSAELGSTPRVCLSEDEPIPISFDEFRRYASQPKPSNPLPTAPCTPEPNRTGTTTTVITPERSPASKEAARRAVEKARGSLSAIILADMSLNDELGIDQPRSHSPPRAPLPSPPATSSTAHPSR